MAIPYNIKKTRTQSLPKCFPSVFTSNSPYSSAKRQYCYEELQHVSYLNQNASFFSASPKEETLSPTTTNNGQNSNHSIAGNPLEINGSGTNSFQFCREGGIETTQDDKILEFRRVSEANMGSKTPSDVLDPSRIFSPELSQELYKSRVDWILGPSPKEDLPSNVQAKTTHQSSLLNSLELPISLKTSCNQDRSCMQAAIETLWTLNTNNVSNFCLSNNTPKSNGAAGFVSPRSTEDVLQKNKNIEKILGSILACACFERPKIQVLLVNICHRLLIWYKAIIPCHRPMLSIATSFLSRERPGAPITHQPVRIGEYCLDETLELRIKAQIVYAELQNLKSLIGILMSRMMAERKQSGYSHESSYYSDIEFTPIHETQFSEDLRGKLATLLHSQLHTTMIDLKRIYTPHA